MTKRKRKKNAKLTAAAAAAVSSVLGLSMSGRADRGAARRDGETRPGAAGHRRQNEDAGGAAPGLPAPHRRPQGEPLRQRGTLQHAPDRCQLAVG